MLLEGDTLGDTSFLEMISILWFLILFFISLSSITMGAVLAGRCFDDF